MVADAVTTRGSEPAIRTTPNGRFSSGKSDPSGTGAHVRQAWPAQDQGYVGSLTDRAAPVRPSGLNVSIITASSSVRSLSSLRSRARLRAVDEPRRVEADRALADAGAGAAQRSRRRSRRAPSSESTFEWWYGTFTALGSKSYSRARSCR